MRLAPSRRLVAAASLAAILVASGAARAADPVRTLDLRALYGSAPADIESRRQAYDTLVAASCVQGIANRAAPNLYLYYTLSVIDGAIDTDKLWWDRLQDPVVGGNVLAGRAVEPVADIEAAIAAYAPLIHGLAVWDEKVPATVNAAFTAAGADDLLVVRWDASPTSLYQKLKTQFPVVVKLVNDDGSSRFLDKQGGAVVPDTTRQTSQSAKADAYVWALEKYAKVPGKLSLTELGWMLDGTWIPKPQDYNGALSATNQWQLPNHDWLIAKRGLPFDLSPWGDVVATDDPGQPIGTDAAVLNELMSAARASAGSASITIRGFFAWQFKYTNLEGLPASHHPVMGEWTGVKAVSPFAAGLDADAPGMASMANASFFTHVPLAETPEPQRRPTAEDLVGQGFLKGLAGNGGFEDGEAGWTVHLTNHVVYTDTSAGPTKTHSGLRVLECNTTAVNDDTQDNLFRDGPGAPPGTRVNLRAFVRSPGGPMKGELAIWGLGGTQESVDVPFTADTTWKEVRASLDVAQAGHTSMRGQVYLRTANANLDIDDVAFYAGDPAAGGVEPASYVLWFVGDYDASAWLYQVTPVTWDHPGRGIVPFAWDFSGHLATRFPPFFNHALATRTERDFFIGADSGAGYANPSQMDDAARAIWASAGVQAARRLDSSASWILNPLDPVDAKHLGAVTPFCGDGVLLMAPAGGVAVPSIVDHAPVVALDNLGGDSVAEMAASVLAGIPQAATQATFHSFREVLKASADIVDVSQQIVVGQPERKARFVDPYSFFYLARAAQGGANTHRASYRVVAWNSPAAVGKPAHVTLKVHNDGWETWNAAAPNPYRVGANVSVSAPAPRTLPSDPAGYPVRVSLAADVPPGGDAMVDLDLPAQAAEGGYIVQIDMVQEGVTWFETEGDIPLQRALVIATLVPVMDAGVDSGPMDASASAGSGGAGGAGGAGGLPGGSNGEKAGCGCHVGADELPGRWERLAFGVILGAAMARAGRRRARPARARGAVKAP